MIEIKIADDLDILKIQRLAEQTWWFTYSSIIPQEQIQYMLNTLYSKEVLQKLINDQKQNFILLYEDKVEQAFASYGQKSETMAIYKIHKLYVSPPKQKKGFGRLLIEEIKIRLLQLNIHTLELNVNRHNPAKLFYEKLGFKIINEEDIPIGPFWMNDYVMRLQF